MRDIVDVLVSRNGAARFADLRREVSRRGIETAVRDGRVVRVGGVYALPTATPALLTAVVHGGVLTCVSAVQHHGLAVLTAPEVPHVAVPRSRGRTASAVRAPFPAVLHRYDRVGGVVRGAVPAAEALARVLLCRPPAEALVSVDAALHEGRVTLSAIDRALPPTAPADRRLLLRLANSRAASPTETLARLALGAAGLQVEVGVPITGVGWVDLLVEGRIVVELDGFAYHSGTKEFAGDRRRDRELVARGFTVLRFTYVDVVTDPQRVVRAVRAALVSLANVHGQPRL